MFPSQVNKPTVGASFAILLVAVMLQSCATVSREAARDLANQGVATMSGQKAAYRELGEAMEQDLEGMLIKGALVGADLSLYRPYAQQLDEFHQHTFRRMAVLDAFSHSYEALADFADFDAKSEFKEAVDKLGGEILAYAKASQPGVYDAAANALNKVATQVAGAVAARTQSRRLREGSMLISSQLDTFLKVLESEQELFLDAEARRLKNQANIVTDLYAAGFGEPISLIQAQIEAGALDADFKQVADIYRANKQAIKPGVEEVLRRRSESRQRHLMSLSGSRLLSFRELARIHKELEAGRPIDVAQLRSFIADTNATLLALQAYRVERSVRRAREEEAKAVELLETLQALEARLGPLLKTIADAR